MTFVIQCGRVRSMSKHNSIQDIGAVVEYFGTGAPTPIITAEFLPGKGWIRRTYKKRVSRAWVRKLRREGVTSVELTVPDDRYWTGRRSADFRVEELLRVDRRPLFTGNLIGAAVAL